MLPFSEQHMDPLIILNLEWKVIIYIKICISKVILYWEEKKKNGKDWSEKKRKGKSLIEFFN